MSSRGRRSTARPIAGRASVAHTPGRQPRDELASLPPYKKPSHPLSHEAQTRLRLLKGRTLDDITKHNKQAVNFITEAAGSINDTLREKEMYVERRRKKWERGINIDEQEDEEQKLAALQKQVDEATKRLEESMRAVIDGQMGVQRIDEGVEWLRQNAPRELEAEYNTQLTQRESQRQSQLEGRRRTLDEDGDEEMDDDEGPTPGPTPLDRSGIALTGASEMFADRMQRRKDEYTSISLNARYAKNNNYIGFKKMVHDAKYGDEGPPLGNPDTWFTETGSPAPGVTNTQRGDLEDDDDIVIDKATINTRCPLTYQSFKEPYSSNKCPHTFEKYAILEMIRMSNTRVGGGASRTGERAVECPVAGCSQLLSAADLHHDAIIVRKIKRLQQAEREDGEDSDGDDEGLHPDPSQIDGSDDVPKTSSRVQVPVKQEAPQSSIIEDLGEPSDHDDEKV